MVSCDYELLKTQIIRQSIETKNKNSYYCTEKNCTGDRWRRGSQQNGMLMNKNKDLQGKSEDPGVFPVFVAVNNKIKFSKTGTQHAVVHLKKKKCLQQ